MILRSITIILFFYVTGVQNSFGQKDNETPYFLRLTSLKGVPIQAVYDIKFDHLGYAWIASRQGLFKYDGHRFREIKYFETQDSVGFNPHVKKIEIGSDGKVWIGSLFNGVFEYDYNRGNFQMVLAPHGAKLRDISLDDGSLLTIYTNGDLLKYDFRTKNKVLLSSGIYTYKVLPDKKGGAWVAAINGLLHIQRDFLLPNISRYLDGMDIASMVWDSSGFIWLSDGNDLFKFFPDTGDIEHFELKNKSETLILKVLNLFVDENYLWLANEGSGLVKVNKQTAEISIIRHDPINHNSISSNTVLSVREDKFGNIWTGNNQGGVNILLDQSHGITYHKGGPDGPSKKVLSTYVEPNGDEWIGTDGEGLLATIDGQHRIWNLTSNKGQIGNYVQFILKIREGTLLIGSYDFGLSIYKKETDQIKRVSSLSDGDRRFEIGPDIRTMYKDANSRIWIASKKALFVTDSLLKVLKVFDYKTDIPCEIVSCIDGKGTENIILGTVKGELYEIDLHDLSLTALSNRLIFENDQGFPKFDVNKLKIDVNGAVWVGTNNQGLYTMSPDLRTITKFKRGNFNEPYISSLESDLSGNIWFSTSNSVYQYNVSNQSLLSVSNNTGFYNHYLKRSSFRDHRGDLYFGGTNGLVKITPYNVETSPTYSPSIIPTDFFIQNVKIVPSKKGPLRSGIEQTRDITLAYDQSSFSLGFTILGQLVGSDYDLSYKMSPLELDWRRSGNDRVAKYTNVPPGTYTMQVKLDNSENEEVKPLKMRITVTPPWWQTYWAYAIFAIIVILTLGLSYRYLYKWTKLKQSLHLEKVLREKEKSLNQMKINFFTKISHEIRTPLTLIIGPLMKLKETCQYDYKASNYINIVQFNAERLTHLTEQVLDLGKKETGKLTLRLTNKPVTELFGELTATYHEVARQKQLEFESIFPEHINNFWCDYEKLEQILFNLLSNAFKYSLAVGKVVLKVAENLKESESYPEGYLKIVVLDQGKGISENDLEHIFDMFYRSPKEEIDGYGIGLALVNELVKLHGGEIDVTSKVDKGTCFTVKLPFGKCHPKAEEQVYINIDHEQLPESAASPTVNNENKVESLQYSLLIVEDNLQILQFIKGLFIDKYHVLTAHDGRQGLKMAKQHMPDVVLSDVMMPEMDGYEMTYHIKNHAKTSHIPVLLLTARAAANHKIEGLENGADDYLTKPFDLKTLQLKVENLLKAREKAEQFIRQEILADPKPVEAHNAEESFLKELIEVIEEKLQDTDLKINEIARLMGMSHVVLYRKCVSITGHTVVDLIKITRLKKAVKLIEAGQYNISGAAYEVGFNDVKYFRKCFKAYFGKAPSAYMNSVKKTS